MVKLHRYIPISMSGRKDITMRAATDNGTFTIYLDGRIDSTNAPDVEKEILELAQQRGENSLVLDIENLAYISSAGLRVLMKLRKTQQETLTVLGASPEVYDIFETTGFTELLDVHKRLRELDVTDCPVIGQGGNGTIYRLDEDTIVKVYKPWIGLAQVDREREYARTAFVNGIPSVIAYDTVKCGDSLGVVFEMLKSDTLGHAMRDEPDRLEEYAEKHVALAKTLHSTHVPTGSFERIQDVYHRLAGNLDKWCSKEEISLLHSIIDDIPETDTVTHNDLHPGNIMIQDGELLLIDMPEVTVGPPVCDLIAIYRDMVSGPSGKEKGHIEQSVGMPAEQIIKAGNLFFAGYTGITDPDALKAYYEKLGLLYAFNVSLVPGSGSEKAMQLAPVIMENLFKRVVIPNEQAIRALFKTM